VGQAQGLGDVAVRRGRGEELGGLAQGEAAELSRRGLSKRLRACNSSTSASAHARIAHVQTTTIPSCDVLLFITTPSERQALEQLVAELGLVADWRAAARHDSLLGEYFDLGSIGGHRVLAVPTKMGALTATGSARQAVLFQAVTQARALIAIGMAFGINRSLQQFR
jgi:hypothetical protein